MVHTAHSNRVPGILLCILALASLTVSLSAQVRTINLPEMAQSAGFAFVGSVVDVRSGQDELGDICTWTTFRVERPIGIMPVQMVVTKQFGGTANGLSHYVSHMRYFQSGERVLVMFYPESELGFTSPIGLDQAVWRVSDDGRVLGVTEAALSGMDARLARHGIVPAAMQDIALPKFIGLVEELLSGRTSR